MFGNKHQRSLNEIHERVHRQWPRLQIMLMLAITGSAAFLTSFVLLKLGVTQMVVRYPIAIAVAYGVFILLIGFWLWMQRTDVTAGDVIERGSNVHLPDLGPIGPSGGGGNIGSGGGVRSGSAGTPSAPSGSSGGSGFDLPGLDLDDALWVLLLIIVVLAAIVAIFYVVYIAPALLAEVLIDSLLAAGLYKTVKAAEGRHWLKTVLRKTVLPAIFVLICFTVAGFCVQKLEPDAASIGEAYRMMTK